MDQLMQGRTTFVIAHRLHTLQSCDVLLRLEGGRLVELRSDVTRALDESMLPPPRAVRRSDG
jgi:ABC-type transport system involved in Fe-S cluster assembly fused permease/ATPase subunit